MVLARQGTPAPMTRQSKKENDYVCSSPNNRLGLAQQPPGYPGMVVFVVFDNTACFARGKNVNDGRRAVSVLLNA
jgi:hypothetical protein